MNEGFSQMQVFDNKADIFAAMELFFCVVCDPESPRVGNLVPVKDEAPRTKGHGIHRQAPH
jgi:hypothetical protein